MLEENQIERILHEAETALRQYVTGQGEIVFASPAHIVTGVKEVPDLQNAGREAN